MKARFILIGALLALASAVANAEPTTIVQNESGSVRTRARVLKFPNGTIANSAGTVTVTFPTLEMTSVAIGSATMTAGNPKLEVYGYNVTDSTAQGGYIESHDYGASGNNIVLGAYNNSTQSPNLRLQVDNNTGAHIGFNVGGTQNSAVTVSKVATYDSDLDAVLGVRGFAGMSGGDSNEILRFWMNTAGGTIDTNKGGIFLTPASGRVRVDLSSLTVSGGDVIISSTGYALQFPDGTRQTTAASGSSTFSQVFHPDQAKLPGTNPCAISNSTTTLTSFLLCDAGSNESVSYSTVLNPYAGGTLSVAVDYSMASATADSVVIISSVACISPGDSQDVDTKTFAAGASGTDTVPGTAGHLDRVTVTGLNNSCAQNDLLVVYIENADATATGAIEIRKVRVYE